MDRFNADPLSSEAVLSIWNYFNSSRNWFLCIWILIVVWETRKWSNFFSFLKNFCVKCMNLKDELA
jgi:hypothetical protein